MQTPGSFGSSFRLGLRSRGEIPRAVRMEHERSYREIDINNYINNVVFYLKTTYIYMYIYKYVNIYVYIICVYTYVCTVASSNEMQFAFLPFSAFFQVGKNLFGPEDSPIVGRNLGKGETWFMQLLSCEVFCTKMPGLFSKTYRCVCHIPPFQ